MTDLLAEIRSRRLAAEEQLQARTDRKAAEVAERKASRGPTKKSLRQQRREAAARVAGWTNASLSCRSLLWGLEYHRCAELCPQQVAPRHEADFIAVAKQTIAALEALIALSEARARDEGAA